MRLLTIKEITDFLNHKFAELDSEISDGLILTPSKGNQESILKLKEVLKIMDLSDDFIEFMMQYDLGNFSLSNIQFGYEDDYIDRLIELNSEAQYWYQDALQAHVLVIANGDPFTILLSLKDEGIYAISPEISFEQKIKIAGSFTHFVRGLGTAFKAKRKEEQKEFLELSEKEFNLDSIVFGKTQSRLLCKYF